MLLFVGEGPPLVGVLGEDERPFARGGEGLEAVEAGGQLVIMKSDQLKLAQDIASAINGLAILLPIIAIALFALAVFLARGRRRETLRTTGWCFLLVGVLLLILRRVGGDTIVNSLVQIPANKPAVHDIWDIATSLLRALSIALVAYGLTIIVATAATALIERSASAASCAAAGNRLMYRAPHARAPRARRARVAPPARSAPRP